MQKSGYVSNLVDMREQLRRNYRNPDDIPAEASAENSVAETTSIKGNRFDSEARRDARDLEGRLLSALATARSESDLLAYRQKEFAARIEKLEALMAEMENLNAATSTEYRSRVDHLRYRFFEIAVENGETPRPSGENPTSVPHKSGAWIIAGAIILGALIVGGAFLLCF
ncbi:MAG: hypothetical protein MJ033_03095 [Victivallaceae bacterium]|nr:hypothetical protein [Victivallaceae bacterium]